MSDAPSQFTFPHRTPLFTTVVVLVAFALFGWLAKKFYAPQAAIVEKIEGVRTPEDRKVILAEHRAKEHAEAGSYGWVDQKAGVVRLPIDRAIELVVKEHAKK